MSEEPEKQPLSVYDFLMAMIDQAAGLAWQKLGLQPDFVTGKIAPDFAEARVAIDLVAKLSAMIDEKLDDSDRREMQNLVSNLRLNYVEKTKTTSG